ncbi:hypothetical protein [Roseiconus lacunae]|uniref:hypothetical protein n=1 Tax=Roseiconus lacunae TaxID=2605694 RepID=UPI001E4EBAF1|nr:hypothetical protein [Roseiconus lacunae]MCD0462368.1 hypothetical protein [Roseiconus lacunae]
MNDPITSIAEIERKYRVLKQTIGMHGILRDRYNRLFHLVETSLLFFSVILCGTTFAGAEVFEYFDVSESDGKVFLGVLSVALFGVSVVLISVDWRTKAELHTQAVANWSKAMQVFRDARLDDASWDLGKADELHSAYWQADKDSPNIPNDKFGWLKQKHLLAVEVSTLMCEFPGCPRFILSAMVRGRATWKALSSLRESKPRHAADDDDATRTS